MDQHGAIRLKVLEVCVCIVLMSVDRWWAQI